VIGSVTMKSAPAIEIPASALTQFSRLPAVWIVDPKNHTVLLRNIELARHEPEAVIVGRGLDSGDIVVTAGVQALHPGEQVRLLGASS
jgi:multidrug efflux pump subunit AcrA (membrane-fusion protein)